MRKMYSIFLIKKTLDGEMFKIMMKNGIFKIIRSQNEEMMKLLVGSLMSEYARLAF